MIAIGIEQLGLQPRPFPENGIIFLPFFRFSSRL